jgi:hypothetical protein
MRNPSGGVAGCLRLIPSNRAWLASTTWSTSSRALFSTSTGCVSCRWTTHLTRNMSHFAKVFPGFTLLLGAIRSHAFNQLGISNSRTSQCGVKTPLRSFPLYFRSSAMANVLIEFVDFPEHREILGTLLISYGEIEWALTCCVQQALDISPSDSTRILFRVKGEGARIDVADAIARPAFKKIGLEGQWGNAIGAVRHCKKIRNQYAHCHWRKFDDGVLRFLDLDQEAAAVEGPLVVEAIPMKLGLLQRQRSYFIYALDWLYYLEQEYQKRVGRSSNHDQLEPKSVAQPPLYDKP